MERVLRGPLSCNFSFPFAFNSNMFFLPWHLETTHAQTHKSLDIIYIYNQNAK